MFVLLCQEAAKTYRLCSCRHRVEVLPAVWDLSWFCRKAYPGSISGGQVLSLILTSWATWPWKPQGCRFLIWFPVLPRICFPVQVNRLPRETLLCATLYALPIPPPGSSSESNKQRRVPEALGWVTAPLFNFRQYVDPGQLGLGREEGIGRERPGRCMGQCPLGRLARWGSPAESRGSQPWWRGPRHRTGGQHS